MRTRTAPIEHPDTTNESQRYWNGVLNSYGLFIDAGRYVTDRGRGKGGILLSNCDSWAGVRTEDDDPKSEALELEDKALSALFYGRNLKNYLPMVYAEERFSDLLDKFMCCTARQAAARFGINPGTAKRLQQEFFEERPDRPEIEAARRALGYQDTDKMTVVYADVRRACLYLVYGTVCDDSQTGPTTLDREPENVAAIDCELLCERMALAA